MTNNPTHDNLLQLNQLPENNKNPIAESNNDYDISMDTPRTDAVEYRHCPPQPEAMLKKHEDSYALSRQLERELAVSLQNQVKTESNLLQSQDINAFLDTEFRIACKRAEKAETEVERLRGLVNESIVEKSNLSIALVNCQADLRRAIEIADEFWNNQKQAVLVYHHELVDELDQLEATLNPTNK